MPPPPPHHTRTSRGSAIHVFLVYCILPINREKSLRFTRFNLISFVPIVYLHCWLLRRSLSHTHLLSSLHYWVILFSSVLLHPMRKWNCKQIHKIEVKKKTSSDTFSVVWLIFFLYLKVLGLSVTWSSYWSLPRSPCVIKVEKAWLRFIQVVSVNLSVNGRITLSIPILKSRLYPELLERLYSIQRWDSMLPLVPSNQVRLVLIRIRL